MKHKQPRALKILFLTEMWEQYGFYSLQPLLIFFLIKKLSFTDAHAYLFSGQFAAMLYLTPVIGGWIADRFLGSRMAILLGGLFLCMGYALLALGQSSFYLGLAFVIMGNGLFKPNVSSFLGEFYTRNDARREAGFTLFYVGINIGALLAMLCAGYIQKLVGWSACFGVASFMLLLSMSIFRRGFRYFEDKGLASDVKSTALRDFFRKKRFIFLWACLALVCIYYSLTVIGLGSYGLYAFGILFCLYVTKVSWKLDATARRHILALMMLFAIAIFYKAMFFETYFVVNVFTDRLIDRTVFGHEIPAIAFLSLGAFFSILFGPVWARLLQSNKIKCSIPFKFALSILIFGGSIQLLAWATQGANALLPGLWIIVFRIFFSISELFIFPMGISMVTEYAPKNCVSMMMGAWFMSAAFGGKLAGFLGTFADVPKGVTDLHHLHSIYHQAFQQCAGLCLIMFLACLALVPFIHNLLNHQLIIIPKQEKNHAKLCSSTSSSSIG